MKRIRRLRINSTLRTMLDTSNVKISDFIYPLFVVDGENIKNTIESMPDVYQMSIDNILKECEQLINLGINSVILFAVVSSKDSIGSEALKENSLIAKTTKAIKSKYKDIFVISDLCCCEYTDHGHCGILHEKDTVDNDKTLELLNKQALIHLKSGVDMIAPSGMMDGVIESLRDFMDKNDYKNIPIMSYSTKFASSYYGPFRDVADSTPSYGDRKSYQMNIANTNEAILESIQDDKEGADILMVKPALAYLDIIYQIKQHTKLPLAIYNVSGEYSMLKMAQKYNLVDYEKVLMENMIAFKRAGADIIISYHAKEVAKILKNNN